MCKHLYALLDQLVTTNSALSNRVYNACSSISRRSFERIKGRERTAILNDIVRLAESKNVSVGPYLLDKKYRGLKYRPKLLEG